MEISLGEAITMTARNKPDAPSFVFADGSAHAFAQTNARVNRLASALTVKRAEPVAFFYDVRYAELLAGLPEAHQSIRLFVALNEDSGYEALLATGTEDEPPVIAGDADVIGLAFTSGTTGLPKGVVQSQQMMKAIVTEQIIEYRLHPGEVRYSAAADPGLTTGGAT